MKRVITIIVRVTSRCDLNCRYCYVIAERKNENKLSISNLKTFIKNTSEGFDKVEYIWHGGEPLMNGLGFYKEIVKIQKEEQRNRSVEFRNTLQTNSLLLNDSWLEFFSEHGFGVGISLDPPENVQLMHRGVKSDVVLKKAELIREYLGSVGVLCVISRLNVHKAREIFSFFESNGFSAYGILPLKEVPLSDSPGAPDNQELFNFYRETFDIWLKSNGKIKSIEPLESMIRGLAGEQPPSCSFASSCLKKMVGITQDGEVLPCNSLEEEDFVMGNIFEEPLLKIIYNRKTTELRRLRAKAIKNHCNGCEYVSICRGGCRSDAYWYSGGFDGAYPFCEARRMTFDYLRSQLRERLGVS